MKCYIKYLRPFEDEHDEPPIEEIWSDGEKPKKKLADSELLFVYDEINEGEKDKLVNKRPWNGVE